MSLGGVKQRLLNEIISLYFGEPSETVAEIIERCGPCPIGLVAQMSNFPLADVKTIVLSLYSHGVVSISREGSQTLLTVNSLPSYVLSAPSVLLEQIEEQFQNPNFCESVRLVLLNGIVEFIPSKTDKNKRKKAKPISPLIELPDDFENCVEVLIEAGIFNRRIVECESFTTTDVFSFERRIENLNLIKKKTVSSPSTADLSKISDESALVTITSENPYSITINWNGVASFLRARYICNFSQIIRNADNESMQVIEGIIETTKCSDYTTYKNSMMKDDDSVRTDIFGYPRLEYTQLASHLTNDKITQSDTLFAILDAITDSQMNFLKSGVDGSYWDVTTPRCIRSFQLHHIEMFLEQNLSKYHRRCFNEMRELKVADTSQIEKSALLSEQDARNSLYELCRRGFVQMQGIPKNASDKMINQRSIFVFRYDEEAAIEAYRLIIGEHSRRLLNKISELHKEFEQNQQMELGNMTAAKANEKKEKQLCCFSAQYANAMKTFILFAEM